MEFRELLLVLVIGFLFVVIMRLEKRVRVLTCPYSGLRYREIKAGVLRCLDLDETAPLPKAA